MVEGAASFRPKRLPSENLFPKQLTDERKESVRTGPTRLRD